jgi:hypothetical protein
VEGLIGWLPVSVAAKGRLGLKFMSGYGGVKFDKGLTDKELRVLEMFKK